MATNVFIDCNVWDHFFENGFDLCAELPQPQFNLYITKEVEVEIGHMPEAKMAYVKKYLENGSVKSRSFFGFSEETPNAPASLHSGFGEEGNLGVGWRMAEECEIDFIKNQKIGSNKRPTELLKNHTDVFLAAQAFRSVILTYDAKKTLKIAGKKNTFMVVQLKDFDYNNGVSLSKFIMDRLATLKT